MTAKVQNQGLLSWHSVSETFGCFRGRSIQALKEFSKKSLDQIKKIPLLATSKIESTIFTKRSYTKRDYIIPLSLLGSLFFPNRFLVYGWQVFVAQILLHALLMTILQKYKLNTQFDEKTDKKFSALHPFHFCISSPIVEECFFRGLLQNGLSFSTGSPTLGIVVTSLFFGAAHFSSHEKGNYGQAISSGCGAVIMGLLNHHYGILNSIYAHSVINSLAGLSILILDALKKPDSRFPSDK